MTHARDDALGTSRYTRQVWAETADAHEAATAVSACSPSRRKARADLPAPPVDSERAFPRRRPPAARPSPAPCYASWALLGTARALARPIAVRSRAEGLDTDAARLPTPLLDSEGPPSRSAARAEGRDLRPLHVPFSRRSSTLARRETPFPKIPRVHARNECRFRELESEIAHNPRDFPEITHASSGVRKFL